MRLPSADAVSSLLELSAPHGILSVCLHIEPEDRSDGWRIALKNGLSEVVARAGEDDRDARMALESTAQRVLDRYGADHVPDEGRAHFGFVEVTREGDGREEWYQAQVAPPRNEVVHNPKANLYPLVTVLDDGAARGIVLTSSERARLLSWNLGLLEEVEAFEIELSSEDWRERKSRRPPNPSAGQGASSSGRDQHNQRLDANRQRFLREIGEIVGTRARQAGWSEVLVLGQTEHAREVAEAANDDLTVRVVDDHDLISAPVGQIQERLEQLLEELNRERERELIERIREKALADGRGALGLQRTAAALWEGRVEQLVLDAEREFPHAGLTLPGVELRDDVPLAVQMIEMAYSTSAGVTPLEGSAAESLAEHEGIGALLRY